MNEPNQIKTPNVKRQIELQHFKSAYSRALNFVCEQKFQGIPIKPDDDAFFCTPPFNCCATDILVAKVKELMADRDRLDWLFKNSYICIDTMYLSEYLNTREAIDAARKEQP